MTWGIFGKPGLNVVTNAILWDSFDGSIYLFIVIFLYISVLVHVEIFSIFVYQSCHIYFLFSVTPEEG